MGAAGRSHSPGEPITVLMIACGEAGAVDIPPGAAVLPGHFPDLLATFAELALDAAAFWEPGRCEYCASLPQACEQCSLLADEQKSRRNHELHELLAEALRARSSRA
jgi:hypothetical protein